MIKKVVCFVFAIALAVFLWWFISKQVNSVDDEVSDPLVGTTGDDVVDDGSAIEENTTGVVGE